MGGIRSFHERLIRTGRRVPLGSTPRAALATGGDSPKTTVRAVRKACLQCCALKAGSGNSVSRWGAGGAPPAPKAPPPPSFALTDGSRLMAVPPSANVRSLDLFALWPAAQKSECRTRFKKAWEKRATLSQHKLRHNTLPERPLGAPDQQSGGKDSALRAHHAQQFQISAVQKRPRRL